MKKHLFIAFLFFSQMTGYAQSNGHISIGIIQPKVYLVKDDWFQQLNFDLNIENKTSETIELDEIELYVYDENDNIVSIKRLYDGGVSSSIRTIPVRQIAPEKKLTVYNPFTVFHPSVDLHRLKYILFFTGDSQNRYTAEIDIRPELYIPKTELTLPLNGKLFVVDGNDLYSNHRRFDINDPMVHELLDMHTTPGLFAIDFSIIDSLGKKYSGERENGNYAIFGETVYAPAGGKIVKTSNEYEDNIPGKMNFTLQDMKANKGLFPGNCVVIDHLNGEYSFLVHLKKGSVRVREGEMVTQGQPVGEVGNSGSSMYPHLHYQLCDGADYLRSNGLPVYFHAYNRIAGEERIEKGYLNTGDIVEPVSPLSERIGKKESLQFDTLAKNKEINFWYEQSEHNPYLNLLRSKYPVDSLIKDLSSDREKASVILNWVHRQWKHDGGNEPIRNDAISILEEAREGSIFVVWNTELWPRHA